MMHRKAAILLGLLLVVQPVLAGCLEDDQATDTPDPTGEETGPGSTNETGKHPGLDVNRTAPEPPGDESYTGLQPVEFIFDGSLRTELTRVLLVPPAHGDMGSPTNASRDALSYLQATVEGIMAWEPAIDRFIEQHPEYAYLDNVTVQLELFEGETPETAGYDIVIGYAETSGGAFRGVAIKGPANEDQQIQQTLNENGLGDLVHFGHRYILLSLFASAPRAGQEVPDYPETHEVRGVTMHEFAHVWGLGHSTAWTQAYGPDLMNSPYPFIYGDGDPAGDGGERSMPLCISSLDLYGLAHLYRWLPNGTWEATTGNSSLAPPEGAAMPRDVPYETYCDVFEDAEERAQAWMRANGLPVQT